MSVVLGTLFLVRMAVSLKKCPPRISRVTHIMKMKPSRDWIRWNEKQYWKTGKSWDLSIMTKHVCPLCRTSGCNLKYDGMIRAGSVGKLPDRKFKVYECSICGAASLSPMPRISYES